MRISDWSSDVCSSDLGADRTAQVGYPPRGTRGEGVGTDRPAGHGQEQPRAAAGGRDGNGPRRPDRIRGRAQGTRRRLEQRRRQDRKSVVWGKGGTVRVDLGGRGLNKKKKK